jgi:hypothetical protein
VLNSVEWGLACEGPPDSRLPVHVKCFVVIAEGRLRVCSELGDKSML